jgi:putative peptidoglycan lipid II flippase
MRSLLRNNLVVAVGTALSRVSGLARVAVFGIVIGQTALADAYNSANSSPNAVYELLLGGVLSASLVPLFTKQAEDRDDRATSAVVSVAVVALTALTALAVLAAPWIFRLFSLSVHGNVDPNDYRSAGTALARIFLVQIFFYGISALATALLQARRRYFAAAWVPVLSNVVIIISLLLVANMVNGRQPQLVEVLTDARLRWTLGLGATIGIAIMALAVLPALRDAEVPLAFNFEYRHPAVRQLLKMSAWTFGYVVANQVAIVVIQNLAQPGSGGVDAYAKAYIFFVLPHGLLAMSIATTFTPEMASSVRQRNKAAFIDRASIGLRLIALLTLPAAAGMFVLRRAIIGVVMQHGNFDQVAALNTSRALGGFAIGLLGFSLYLFALRGFYAHGDTRTPFVINLFENLINIVLALVLYRSFGVMGLALSFAIAYLVSATWALKVLSYKVPGFPVRATLRKLAPMVLAAVVMAEVMWVVARLVGSNAGIGAVVRVVFAGVVGLAAYVGLLAVLGVSEVQQVRARLTGRLRRPAAPSA